MKLLALLLLFPTVAAAQAPRIACSLDEDAPSDLSKKSSFLLDKAERIDRRAARPPRVVEPDHVLTLHNVWTNESLPLVVGTRLGAEHFDELVRCHYTNQATSMDQRLLPVIERAAARFKSSYVEIVSGFRAPKYQLMLRKKGHEVARDSEHPLGHAVDFRIPNVPTKILLRFVKSLRLGGVGYYPDSKFVHADVGRVRFWKGH